MLANLGPSHSRLSEVAVSVSATRAGGGGTPINSESSTVLFVAYISSTVVVVCRSKAIMNIIKLYYQIQNFDFLQVLTTQ